MHLPSHFEDTFRSCLTIIYHNPHQEQDIGLGQNYDV